MKKIKINSSTALFSTLFMTKNRSIFFKEKQFTLTTIINEEGIYVQLFPFLKYKFFPWSMISNAYIRKYKPIKEYGGWGIRTRMFKLKLFNIKAFRILNNDIAYSMSGKIGLQLELTNGKRVLIGTRKSIEMEEVLRKLRK